MSDPTRLKYLIVDDFSTMRRIVRGLLKEMGCTNAEEAEDGAAALSLLKSQPFDFVVCDINMPNMDGLELLSKLKADANLKDVPVIMITTEGGQAKVLEAVNLGAAGYVRKPFTAEQIKEKLVGII